MKRIVLILMLLVTVSVLADGNEYRIEYLCSDAHLDYYELEAYEPGTWTLVPQGETGETTYLENPNGIARLSFPKPSVGLFVYFDMSPIGIVGAGNIPCAGNVQQAPITDANMVLSALSLFHTWQWVGDE